MAIQKKDPLVIYTIGHSTRPIPEFLEILRLHGIRKVMDVRTIPGSRKNPQYNQETLAETLAANHIRYRHMPGLGGLRRAKKDSPNAGWENASFRGFADYMQTGEFEASVGELIEAAKKAPTAIMCAEAVPWRCHRSLIGDALLARGVTVIDIMSKGSVREHRLTAWAVVDGERITYPKPETKPAVSVRDRRRRAASGS